MIKQGIYRHYKGNLYRVVGIGKHSETLEALVFYQALYGDHGYWVRPLAMFTENIVHEGEAVARFTFQE
ncbi:MAG: DUF1653 domain-containing protein [Alphaproteobacteria bacterium]